MPMVKQNNRFSNINVEDKKNDSQIKNFRAFTMKIRFPGV